MSTGTIPLLEINAGIQVCRTTDEVFEAIVNPAQMKNYFISESSGEIREGSVLIWKFPEMDTSFPVHIKQVRRPEYISWSWDGAGDEEPTLVEISLREAGEVLTFITVTEKSRSNNEAGITWLKRNTEGWANFLACLKAWMEYGVHLRKNAFNPVQLPATKK